MDLQWNVTKLTQVDLSDDEDVLTDTMVSLEARLSELKRKVLFNRGTFVMEKMKGNSAKLLTYTSYLSDSTKHWMDKSVPEDDKLTFRSQKVLCNFINTDAGGDVKDEGAVAAVPIIFGNNSGGKTAVRPLKLVTQQNVPPYTTWIYLERNQRMTEDQSVQGRRRIYYDRVGNETLIASDSEEEEIEDEESKHDFSKGEDYIIWTAAQELGASDVLFEKIGLCIQVKHNEVQARYNLLLNDLEKQAQCETYGEDNSSTVSSHVARHKGANDLGLFASKGAQTGPVAELFLKKSGNASTRKVEGEEKVEAEDLVAAMDSFDNLFCRRCLVFDCRLHGCSQPLVHPSERQPLTIQGSDLQVPCGLHCHLLSQQRHVGTLSSSVPVITTSKAWHLSSLAEHEDRGRVAKRRKTQEGETDWSVEKVGSHDTTVCVKAESLVTVGQSWTKIDRKVNGALPGSSAEAPIVIGEDAPESCRREQPLLASRINSEKILAKSILTDLGHIDGGTTTEDFVDVSFLNKLGEMEERSLQVKVVGAPNKLSVAEGVIMDTGEHRVDQSEVASAKKLARSARKPVVMKVAGLVESEQVQIQGGLVELCQEEEKPVVEKPGSNAARKPARSARKVFAEKVAGAIQLQQLQTHLDPIHILNQREEEQAKEDRHIGCDTCHQGPAIAGTTISVAGSSEPQIMFTENKTMGARSTGKRRNMKVCCEEGGKDVEVHKGQTCLGPRAMISLERKLCRGTDGKFIKFKDNWTPLEKGLYEKGLQIFGKSSCLIASNMLKGFKTCAEVRVHMVAQETATLRGVGAGLHQFPDSLACSVKWDVARARARFYGRKKGSRKLKFTLKSAGQSAIRKRMVNGKHEPCRQYTPCGCLFTCGKQCPCQLNGTCCEKYCGCAKSCKNRFRGCHCAKSQCCSRQCPCFAAERNCDPDVCRNCWIGCGDGKSEGPPQKEDKDNYQCHNMKLLLKQQQRVLLSRSDVAGWGAFIKNTVNKHEYLGEYTGELISHREADKRGKIYDRENSSFLFNLNDQYVLDACRKGDKLKFANHSPNPNCYAKVMMVAGDHRVGIFAKERILAGEELFYDYRYEAGSAPAWARRDEDNGKRDDTGSSERRSKQAS